MILSNLKIGEVATIIAVDNSRYQMLGIRNGSKVKMLRQSFGCLHFRIDMAEYAIRFEDASLIKVVI